MKRIRRKYWTIIFSVKLGNNAMSYSEVFVLFGIEGIFDVTDTLMTRTTLKNDFVKSFGDCIKDDN